MSDKENFSRTSPENARLQREFIAAAESVQIIADRLARIGIKAVA